LCICRLIALPIGRHFKLRENVSKPVVHNDTLEKLFKQHRKIYPSDDVILVMIIFTVPMGFRLVPKSVTLNDPEWRNGHVDNQSISLLKAQSKT